MIPLLPPTAVPCPTAGPVWGLAWRFPPLEGGVVGGTAVVEEEVEEGEEEEEKEGRIR